jgi:hypothetical protein
MYCLKDRRNQKKQGKQKKSIPLITINTNNKSKFVEIELMSLSNECDIQMAKE